MLRKIYDFSGKTLLLIKFIVFSVVRGNFNNPFKKQYSGKVIVLANGPSLKENLPLFEKPQYREVDFIAMNFFAFDETFFSLKPKHYCLADPMFFCKGNKNSEQVEKFFDILQHKVDWSMNLWVPSKCHKHKFLEYSKLKNEYISIINLSGFFWNSFENMRYWMYKRGRAMPAPYTVANMCIYIGLSIGYSSMEIYGLDHTFFDGLFVNEKNQLCNKYNHFYGESHIKPVIDVLTGKGIKISHYLFVFSQMMKSHDDLAGYAKYLKTPLINCTKNSMVDSYERPDNQQ
jgi:hypothetical protein